jgi:hypothetical protein
MIGVMKRWPSSIKPARKASVASSGPPSFHRSSPMRELLRLRDRRQWDGHQVPALQPNLEDLQTLRAALAG